MKLWKHGNPRVDASSMKHDWIKDPGFVHSGDWYKCTRCEMTIFIGMEQTPDEMIRKNLDPAIYHEDCDAQIVATIELA